MTNEKEIRKKIFYLRKLKRQTKTGMEERREINEKIRELKKQISYEQPDQEKTNLIEQIYIIRPEYHELGINLLKFTTEELKKHLEKISNKKQTTNESNKKSETINIINKKENIELFGFKALDINKKEAEK